MTLGQRIQELRKQRGLSQENLGDALGVSRQAVSKWEGDNGIPELDTLIAMSRLFDVTVGQLLGVEKGTEQKDETTNDVDVDVDQIEAVLRRYVDEMVSQKNEGFLRRYWRWIAAATGVVAVVVVVLFVQVGSLRSTIKHLRSDLAALQVNVSNNQNNLSWQIRNTIYDVLAKEAELLSTFEWEIVAIDLDNQTATLRLDATMKEYIAGSKLQFCAIWHKTDDTEGQSIGDWVTGPNFRSEITLPLNHATDFSIRVEDTDGNIKEQVLQNSIHELHPDNFHLYARNLTTPFAITVKGFNFSDTTSKGERAYIIIESIFPDFIWPEKAELTAYINDVEVMSETMTITPSEREKQVFHASIQDVYHDLTLKNGDVLKVVLAVTDNLGRTEQYSDSIGVQDGKLQRKPAEAPVISVN